MMEPEEELQLRSWTSDDVRNFHKIKEAGLIAPWNSLVERTVQLMAASLPKDESEDPDYFCEVAQHIELQCLEMIESRRCTFHEDYERRVARRG